MNSCEQVRDQLHLYALGALDGGAQEVRNHLERCSACRSDFTELQDAVAMLPYQLPPVAPSPDLKRRLFQRIAGLPAELPAREMFDFSAVKWEDSDMPGVSFHWLRPPGDGGTTAALVKILPGFAFRDHRHVGTEDCLVLQGHLRDARGEYHSGDYVFYEAGSIQREICALQGEECILFIVNQQGIEFL